MKYFSTFSGIGGFELGLPKDWECVGFSEIDKYAIQVYQNHFPNHTPYGDITKINEKELPDFDLLCGGFPCQAFSIAGKRGGFSDTRGTMFFHLARISKEKQPRFLLFENVKGLLSHDKGRSFETILRTLDELGYDVQWNVLNSKDYGVPQNRERVFIVGHLRGTRRPEVFSFTGENRKNAQEGPEKQRKESWVSTIDCRYGERWATETYVQLEEIKQPFIVAQRGRYREDGRTKQNLEARKDSITNTLTSVQKDNLLCSGRQIRKLTPTECERLQGFPDGWTEGGIDDIISLETLLTKQLCQNAKYKDVSVQSLLEKSSFVLNITNDGESGGTRISLIQKKEKTQENVSCVIDLLTAEKCVCDITNLGNDTVMLYSLNETSNIDELTKQSHIIEKVGEQSTEQLLKITLDANLIQQKLSTILTAIKKIMESQTFTCAKTGKSITSAIIVLKKSPLNYTNGVLSDLKMESIISISDTQRYKCLGNAVTVNVIQYISKNLNMTAWPELLTN